MKEAIIKISFTVLPNGQVGEMIPTIKSDATLEKITLNALRRGGSILCRLLSSNVRKRESSRFAIC